MVNQFGDAQNSRTSEEERYMEGKDLDDMIIHNDDRNLVEFFCKAHRMSVQYIAEKALGSQRDHKNIRI